MIAAAKKSVHSARLHFSVQDATKLPYAPESFDAVVIANALHIVPEPETEFGGSGGIRFAPAGLVGADSDAPPERHSLPALQIPPIGNATPKGGVWRKRWDSIRACGLGRGRL